MEKDTSTLLNFIKIEQYCKENWGGDNLLDVKDDTQTLT